MVYFELIQFEVAYHIQYLRWFVLNLENFPNIIYSINSFMPLSLNISFGPFERLLFSPFLSSLFPSLSQSLTLDFKKSSSPLCSLHWTISFDFLSSWLTLSYSISYLMLSSSFHFRFCIFHSRFYISVQFSFLCWDSLS